MGAIFNTLMCFLKPGDHVVVHKPLYTCTEYVLNNMMPKYNIEVTYVDAAGDIQVRYTQRHSLPGLLL